MEASKRRRSMLDYKIQQLSKGSSGGSGIILEVLDKPKNNSGSSRNSLSGSDDKVQDVSSDEENKSDAKSMVDVPIHQEDLAVQRTPLIDTIISMVTEKTTSTLTPPTTQAQVTNNWRDLHRDIPLDRIEVFRYDTKGVKVINGIMQTKTELTLEQTQQGVSDEVLVRIEGVEE
ncbi:hypothetical protein Tco_0820381 [Tanacetum coccineum]|uniref:Uncharacterized protein n=1 Tax=Tanacetum coccineum TaxID=301880 RepID=A0ABQ5AC67_9ASTR